jgi:hypothetical protein
MANCWNEDCHNDWSNIEWLYDQVYKLSNKRGRVKIGAGRQRTEEEILAPKEPPGKIIPLDKLYARDPDHFAIQYVMERGFDPEVLAKDFGVGYCVNSEFTLAKRRLYIPIHMDGQLMGWQCRYLGDWHKGLPAKYFSCPSMRRRYMALNYNQALEHKTVLMVEGPFDVFGAGKNAFGVLGKTLSVHMRTRLIKDLKEGQYLGIMLDPNQDKDSLKKGRPHHIDTMYEQLEPSLRKRVFKVWLPAGTDPGSLDTDVLRDVVRDAAREAGIKKLNFKKLVNS